MQYNVPGARQSGHVSGNIQRKDPDKEREAAAGAGATHSAASVATTRRQAHRSRNKRKIWLRDVLVSVFAWRRWIGAFVTSKAKSYCRRIDHEW